MEDTRAGWKEGETRIRRKKRRVKTVRHFQTRHKDGQHSPSMSDDETYIVSVEVCKS